MDNSRATCWMRERASMPAPAGSPLVIRLRLRNVRTGAGLLLIGRAPSVPAGSQIHQLDDRLVPTLPAGLMEPGRSGCGGGVTSTGYARNPRESAGHLLET